MRCSVSLPSCGKIFLLPNFLLPNKYLYLGMNKLSQSRGLSWRQLPQLALRVVQLYCLQHERNTHSYLWNLQSLVEEVLESIEAEAVHVVELGKVRDDKV